MTQKIKEVIAPLLKLEFNVRETLQLLTSSKSIFWSWGVHDMVNIINKGLMFKVNGHHHKGWVLITLNWMDVYEVYLITTHGTIVKQFDMVYCDQLVEIIDDNVERIAEYNI